MAKQVLKAIAFVDGASRGNPGPASIGVVFQDGKGGTLKNLSEKIGAATNNTAEYCALIFALQEGLMMGVKELEIFADSELLVKQCHGEYRVREETLKPLAALVKHLRQGFRKVTIAHVPREQNKLADREANKALDEGFLL
ncbi:MAG: ribonuclease HI family protein [Candidatus Omnitrophota bacterium]